ncbi:MAG TPA: hypothetical protein DD473_08005 [Planctomycetaceae bacterium]|nr:hypothetical protein [Planctomycetaceae bacterium]
MKHTRLQFLCLMSTLLMILGCGEGTDQLPLASVSGVLMKNGTPVPNAEIRFKPKSVKARMSQAITDENGVFELQYSQTDKGAVVGEHDVMVTIYGKRGPSEIEGQPGPPLQPPKEYVLGIKTIPEEGAENLTLEVPSRS